MPLPKLLFAWDIARIQAAMKADGSHWWDKDTMKFFATRIESEVFSGPGGIYFVTSEQPPHGPRMCSVRQFDPVQRKIKTVGEFCSMSKADAKKQARKLAFQTS